MLKDLFSLGRSTSISAAPKLKSATIEDRELLVMSSVVRIDALKLVAAWDVLLGVLSR